MSHGVTIQNNERQATAMMKEAHNKVNTKMRTKGRFQMGIATNGALNRTDMVWA